MCCFYNNSYSSRKRKGSLAWHYGANAMKMAMWLLAILNPMMEYMSCHITFGYVMHHVCVLARTGQRIVKLGKAWNGKNMGPFHIWCGFWREWWNMDESKQFAFREPWNFDKIVSKATISIEESNPAPPETWETRTQNYVCNTLST